MLLLPADTAFLECAATVLGGGVGITAAFRHGDFQSSYPNFRLRVFAGPCHGMLQTCTACAGPSAETFLPTARTVREHGLLR